MHEFRKTYPELAKFYARTAKTEKQHTAFRTVSGYHGARGKEVERSGKARNSKSTSGKKFVGRNQNDGKRHMARSQNRSYRPGNQPRNGGRFNRAIVTDMGPWDEKSTPCVKTPDGLIIPQTRKAMSSYRVDGQVVQTAKRHQNYNSFRKAIEPIAEGEQYSGAEYHEYEFHRDGFRHMRVSGRELLGEARVAPNGITNNALSQGERLLGGMYPVSPHALGSRLALYADLYEEHEFHKMKIIYVPSVPTTVTGSIAFYFRNDVGTPTTTVGRSEIAHAATHPSFISTPVYKSAFIDISPQDINISYFDETTGDFRLEAQGLIQALAASDISSASPSAPVIGNFYIEYDAEFRGAELEYDIVEVQSFNADFQWKVGTTATTLRANCKFQVFIDSSGPGVTPGIQFETPSFSDPADLTDYLVEFTTHNYGTTGTVLDDLAFTTIASDESIAFTGNKSGGLGLWGRFITQTAGTTVMNMFDNLADAKSASDINDGGPGGTCRWAASYSGGGGTPGSIAEKRIIGRLWKLTGPTA